MPNPPETTVDHVLPTKLIHDLDELVRALATSLPRSAPWQRQLHGYLDALDRVIQILRMTIGLRRSDAEVEAAVLAVCQVVRAANRYVATSRADLAIKAAVRLALEMSQQMAKAKSR